MADLSIGAQVKGARRVSTPLVAIVTLDAVATEAEIVQSFNGSAPPIIRYDIIRGVTALNDPGQDAVSIAWPDFDPQIPIDEIRLLRGALALPDRSILFVEGSHELIKGFPFQQAMSNLRDEFKSNTRTLILLGPSFDFPPSLQQDVFTLDSPLPDLPALQSIVDTAIENGQEGIEGFPAVAEQTRVQAARALTGLAHFPADQAASLAVGKWGLDTSIIWDRKRSMLRNVKGLSMDDYRAGFETLGGLSAIKAEFLERANGDNPPALYVRLDEFEKSLGGLSNSQSKGESTGTTDDFAQVFLGAMEDYEWEGAILYGPPGSGKSAFSKCVAPQFEAKCLRGDVGALKSEMLGASERDARHFVKIIRAMGGASVMVLATCNRLDQLTPELRRRFTAGVWFFDLPDENERESIWQVQLRAYGLPLDSPRPACEGWTGAEIRNVCRLAKSKRLTPAECARSIVPVCVSARAEIERYRATAAGAFLSASYQGTYRIPTSKPAAGGRRIEAGV